MSRVRRGQPRCRSAMWICMCGHTPDIVIYSKFHRNPFTGLGALGDRNRTLHIPITLALGLHYRASHGVTRLKQGWITCGITSGHSCKEPEVVQREFV